MIISSESSGRLIDFPVLEGEKLEAGQYFGTVDSTQAFLKKMQIQSAILALESRRLDIPTQLAPLHQQIATARREKERFENLLLANAATQKQVDDINAQIALLETQLHAQSASLGSTNMSLAREVASLKMQLEQTDDQLKKCLLVSPVSGTVLVKYAEQGEQVSPGKPLIKIADMETMVFRAYLTADQLSRISIGQRVTVHADMGKSGTRAYPGQLSWISETSEFTPKTIQTRDERANLVYAIKVNVKNDGQLRIGLYGGLQFIEE